MRISDWSSDVCSSDLDRGDRIIVEPAGVAECLTFEPMVVKLDPEHVEAVEAEGMDIAMAGTDPVDELDPELVGRVGFADELVLVDAEQRVAQAALRTRRLPAAAGADRPAPHPLYQHTGKAYHAGQEHGRPTTTPAHT